MILNESDMRAALSFAWTLALLAAYPEIWDRVYQEIVENWFQPNGSTDDIFQRRFSTPTTIDVYARFNLSLLAIPKHSAAFRPSSRSPKLLPKACELSWKRSIARMSCQTS